ncbi:unnamed protein product [Peronospora belbahrii]|uniref:Uncharacterized protein n=1 Tax=Peronospora belbahrii TaxID=622444 RepID=A0ABN8D3G5_9STRA|nr:unnamed protein product [Peronospora belbahrii]
MKRKGGASAFVNKTSSWNFSKGNKSHTAQSTKQKLKKGSAPHRSHVERMYDLKKAKQLNDRNAKEWTALTQNDELNHELDRVFEYLNKSGPHGDYIYESEPSLKDVNHIDALEKLNALARADPEILKTIDKTYKDGTDDNATDDNISHNGIRHDQTELTIIDYNFLLRVYAVKGLCKEANALLSRMEKNLRPIATEKAVTLVKVTDSTEMALMDALESVPHVIPPNAKSYMLYATALGTDGQAAHAVRVIGRKKNIMGV